MADDISTARDISSIVQCVILPAIMFVLFAFALAIASRARTPEAKVSSWAGLWAGLMTFVIYVVSQLSHIREPNLRLATLPGLLWLPLGGGLAVGFVFLWLVRYVVPTRLVGLITMMLAASSTSSMFTYVFINNLRVSVLYWTLGTALGILLHVVLFPSSVEHVFKAAVAQSSLPAEARPGPLAELLSSLGRRNPDGEAAVQRDLAAATKPEQPT
jgi:hypothetical protein